MTFTIKGRDAGKNVVEFPGGEIQLLSDDDVAELRGARAVRKLSDEKRIAELEAKLGDAEKYAESLSAGIDPLKKMLTEANEAAAEWQERAEKAESRILELEAANALLESASKFVAPKPRKRAAEGGK